ncbi:unnamed protein product [Rhizophagus irregularis]|uniref:Uncharacterized protein n=1 Tax=Rhizophagus irregularis TaxID=588596 RepID=A0A916E6C2_9GLOM|nr:unnamed protein product [Rhizophagus irregularis]
MDDDIKEIKQSSANASSVENPNNVVRLGKLEKMAKPSNTSDSTFNSNVCKPIRTETKSLEVKETDDFLDEVHKKRVSDEIRQRNKEKKIQRELTVPSDLSCVTETSLRNHDENESNTKTVNIVHDQKKISLEDSVQKMPERLNEDVSQRESDSGLVTEIVRDLLQGFLVDDFQREFINTEFIDREHSNSSPVTEELARLFHQASIARKNSIKAKQEEISSWGRYSERFEDKVIKLRSEDKNLKDKTARSQIYNEMKPYLSGVSDEYLRKITSKARKINKLFGYDYDPITLKKIKGIGWHMVNRVTYSADSISRLTNLQIQYIIDRVNLTVTNKTVNNVHDQSHVTSEMITSDTTAPITLGRITSEKIVNASQTIPAEVPAFSQPNASPEMISSDMFQASVSSASQSKPDHSYFRNKILDQYPNLYRECSSENFDYYGMTDETSCGDYICPLCKLGHDDEEIEGRYKAGSYFIKCEQREIEIVA